MGNLTLDIVESSENNQKLEVICNHDEGQLVRLYNEEETKRIVDLVKDDKGSFYVYYIDTDTVDFFNQYGDTIEINYEYDSMILEIRKPFCPPVEVIIGNDIPIENRQEMTIRLAGEVVSMRDPHSNFAAQSMITKDILSQTISLNEEEY